MKVLVVGGGGREHALVWKIAQSVKVKKIYCAPGNPGIGEIAECVNIGVDSIEKLAAFAANEKIDLTVVGPEAPLVAGIVDLFQARGLKIFGASRLAAEIEGSKAFAKDLMQRYGIPTARYQVFEDCKAALAFLERHDGPIVVKADGLAAGKGVVVAESRETAVNAVRQMMDDHVFGAAGTKIVLEEFLQGEEASVLAFTDGETVIPMVAAQDHKRVFDADKGPNTGGMGAYAPAPVVTPGIREQVYQEILLPTVRAMKKEGREYRGVLYAGLMITDEGPKVIEYNARFGDPETQVILPLLKTDLVDIFLAIVNGELSSQSIEWHDNSAVCVVLASGGYPGQFAKGLPIEGDAFANNPQSIVFHAGTSSKDGKLVTSGGRVLGVTAWGANISEAVQNSYEAVKKVSFIDMHYRSDIAWRVLKERVLPDKK